MKTGGGVRRGKSVFSVPHPSGFVWFSFSPVFTGAERKADTGFNFFCYCTVKECKVSERSISSDHAACVLITDSHVGHLAKISFRSFQRKPFLENGEEKMNSKSQSFSTSVSLPPSQILTSSKPEACS